MPATSMTSISSFPTELMAGRTKNGGMVLPKDF
jgi:hypothetical protein